jgi:hypothetical protein
MLGRCFTGGAAAGATWCKHSDHQVLVQVIVDFEDAYQAWRGRPFPHGSADDEDVSDLHADLHLADSMLAGPMVTFAKYGRVTPPSWGNARQKLDQLRFRAQALERSTDGDNRRLAHEYDGYMELLAAAYESYLHTTGQPDAT